MSVDGWTEGDQRAYDQREMTLAKTALAMLREGQGSWPPLLSEHNEGCEHPAEALNQHGPQRVYQCTVCHQFVSDLQVYLRVQREVRL